MSNVPGSYSPHSSASVLLGTVIEEYFYKGSAIAREH